MPDDSTPTLTGKPPKSTDQIAQALETIHDAAQPQDEGPWDGNIVRRLLANPRLPFELSTGQNSVLGIFAITTIFAFWFAISRASPGLGCLTATAPPFLLVVIYSRSAWPLFWLPLAVSLSSIASELLALPTSQIDVPLTFALAWAISTACLALQGTRWLYRNSGSQLGAGLTTLALSSLGGGVSCLMFIVPILYRFDFPYTAVTAYPLMGFICGFILGVPLLAAGVVLVAHDAGRCNNAA